MEAGRLVKSEMKELCQQVHYLLHKYLFINITGQQLLASFVRGWLMNRFGAKITVVHSLPEKGQTLSMSRTLTVELPGGQKFSELIDKYCDLQSRESGALFHIAWRILEMDKNGKLDISGIRPFGTRDNSTKPSKRLTHNAHDCSADELAPPYVDYDVQGDC